MKTRKTLHWNEDDEVTPTADTTTQFNCIPQRSVGSTGVSTSRSNGELEELKRRLQALEEREAGDGREQSRREKSRIRLKDLNISILKSTELEEYMR